MPNTSDFFSNQKDIEDQFSKKDRLIITHPKTFRILEEKLKDSKYNFNFLLVESQKDSSKNEYMEYLIKFMKENDINQQNHITFAKQHKWTFANSLDDITYIRTCNIRRK